MDRNALKESLISAIEVVREVQKETGVAIGTEDIAKIAISLFIQNGRGNGNGNGGYEKRESKPLTVNFGKFKGKSLEEVFKLDKSYLRWYGDKTQNAKVRAECKRLLEQNPVSTGQVTIPKPKVNQ